MTGALARSREPDAAGWRATLQLVLERGPGQTVLRRNLHRGPLRVQRPFYPESNGTCHLYLLHPPGGVVQGDELDVRLNLENDARCLVTTPGATKCYRSEGPNSRLTTRIVVGDGAVCEWLPQETILFDGANVSMSTTIELGEKGSFVGWDITCFGRPAAGEPFENGRFDQTIRIERQGAPLLLERLRLRGNDPAFRAAWGCAGTPVVASLFAAVAQVDLVERVRAAEIEAVWGSQLDGIAVFRCLTPHVDVARRALARVWDVVRGQVAESSTHRPRIWST